MKKILIFILFLSSISVYAQDVITLRTGDQIKAKVTEISQTELRYKRFEHLNGPTIVIPLATVFAINYENGTREVINALTQTSTPQPASGTSQPANVTTNVQPATETPRSANVTANVQPISEATQPANVTTNVQPASETEQTINVPNRMQNTSDVSRTQAVDETNRVKTTTETSHGVKLFGGNLVIATSNNNTIIGLGAKFLYNTSDNFRLGGAFDFFPSRNFGNLTDISAYGHYLIPLNEQFLLYPSVGLGFLGGGGVYSFGLSLGGGIDIAIAPDLVLNGELRFKLMDGGYFTNIAIGLAYRF